MYDYAGAVRAIDAHWPTILPCIAAAIVFTFIYFSSAVRQTWRERIPTEAFVGVSVIFWHDLSFVLYYRLWFTVYDHWWFKAWTFALMGTVLFEGYLIYLVYRFGREERWPGLSQRHYGLLLVLGHLGLGGLLWAFKSLLQDELYFVAFVFTAASPALSHTSLMCLRKNRAGQSTLRQLCMMGNVVVLSIAFMQVDPYFYSAPFLAFAAVLGLWPVANIVLIRSLPAAAQAA
jgi:hypothetical protein